LTGFFKHPDSITPGEQIRRQIKRGLLNYDLPQKADNYESLCPQLNNFPMVLRDHADELNTIAERYTQNSGERDYQWEEEFAKNWKLTQNSYSMLLQRFINCEEWRRVKHGESFTEAWMKENHPYSNHVVRLAETYQESNEAKMNSRGETAEGGIPVISVGGNEKTASTILPENATEADQVDNKAEKKAVGDGVKKTDEKGKDKTGVENS
jgi:hypothetical protein